MPSPNWRPWSPQTDWAQGDALRYLRAALDIAPRDTALPVLRFFQAGETAPHHDDQWVECIDDTRLRSLTGLRASLVPWNDYDPPVRRFDQGPLHLMLFQDGSGLALRRHGKGQGVYALPTLPFVGDPVGVDASLLWQACLSPFGGEPVPHLLPHERLLPTRGGIPSAGQQAVARLARFTSTLRGLFPQMPSPLFLTGGAGLLGPRYTHPEPENLGPLCDVLDRLNAVVLFHLPERMGWKQGWSTHALPGQDPRVALALGKHATWGGAITSAHHRMALLRVLHDPAALLALDTPA